MKTKITKEHLRLMADARESGAVVEDFARAWASVDGKLEKFDTCKVDGKAEDRDGYYLGYLAEAEEMFRRAAKYARERNLGGVISK